MHMFNLFLFCSPCYSNDAMERNRWDGAIPTLIILYLKQNLKKGKFRLIYKNNQPWTASWKYINRLVVLIVSLKQNNVVEESHYHHPDLPNFHF